MILTDGRARPETEFLTICPSRLDAAESACLDRLPFGVVGLSCTGITQKYNAAEIRLSGLRREHVLGQPFFLVAGVCMNNFMVAQRFEDEDTIDAVIDYVLTFRMRPTPVKLRLLKQHGLRLRYLLVKT